MEYYGKQVKKVTFQQNIDPKQISKWARNGLETIDMRSSSDLDSVQMLIQQNIYESS